MRLPDLSWPRSTARRTIAPAQPSDAAAAWRWHRRPEMNSWMPRLVGDETSFTEHFVSTVDRTLIATMDGQVVGLAKVAVEDAWAQEEVGPQAVDQQAEIGWALDSELHGRGLGGELAAELLSICFDGLGLHRVVAVCFSDNTASWRVMEKIGMRREAHFRADSLHRERGWSDSYLYALLEDEWRQLRSAQSEPA